MCLFPCEISFSLSPIHMKVIMLHQKLSFTLYFGFFFFKAKFLLNQLVQAISNKEWSLDSLISTYLWRQLILAVLWLCSEFTWLSMPRVSNIRKKSTAHRWGKGRVNMASGYTTRARPGPAKDYMYIQIVLQVDIKFTLSYWLYKTWNLCSASKHFGFIDELIAVVQCMCITFWL